MCVPGTVLKLQPETTARTHPGDCCPLVATSTPCRAPGAQSAGRFLQRGWGGDKAGEQEAAELVGGSDPTRAEGPQAQTPGRVFLAPVPPAPPGPILLPGEPLQVLRASAGLGKPSPQTLLWKVDSVLAPAQVGIPPPPPSPSPGRDTTLPTPTPSPRRETESTGKHSAPCSVASFYLCPQIFQKNYKILKWREHRSHNFWVSTVYTVLSHGKLLIYTFSFKIYINVANQNVHSALLLLQ